ncbi:MAG: Dihydrofolate reductase [Alphaproteobacteria bacterium ADurb.Bin438]|nr:MAG: Dihydrofolate reductase [Alphaproteobacteria bacterium ADurb.Bin438]
MIRILIAAIDKNRGMGQSKSLSGLPWHIPNEMAYFRNITKGNGIEGKYALVMGSVTYKKILSLKNGGAEVDLETSEPLKMKGRDVLLLSSKNYENHKTFKTLEEISGYDALFICGGLKVYDYAIKNGLVDYILLSKIKQSFECDAFMGEIEQGMELIDTISFDEFDVLAYKANKKVESNLFNQLLSTLK